MAVSSCGQATLSAFGDKYCSNAPPKSKEVYHTASGHHVNKKELSFKVHHNSASLDSLFGCT